MNEDTDKDKDINELVKTASNMAVNSDPEFEAWYKLQCKIRDIPGGEGYVNNGYWFSKPESSRQKLMAYTGKSTYGDAIKRVSTEWLDKIMKLEEKNSYCGQSVSSKIYDIMK